MTTRRDLLIVLGAAAFAPRAVLAQQKQPVLIGWLHTGSREPFAHLFAAFKEGLAALGWKEGAQVVIEERWTDGRNDRLPSFAAELAAKNPAVIVTVGVPALAAAAKAAPKTPIVVAAGDPVAAGLVSNLARPGGMITGVTNVVAQVSEKLPELLLDADPKLRRIGFLADPNNPAGRALLDTARRSIAGRPVEARFEEAAGPTTSSRPCRVSRNTACRPSSSWGAPCSWPNGGAS